VMFLKLRNIDTGYRLRGFWRRVFLAQPEEWLPYLFRSFLWVRHIDSPYRVSAPVIKLLIPPVAVVLRFASTLSWATRPAS
jgi:hypothetical protein